MVSAREELWPGSGSGSGSGSGQRQRQGQDQGQCYVSAMVMVMVMVRASIEKSSGWQPGIDTCYTPARPRQHVAKQGKSKARVRQESGKSQARSKASE